MHRSSPWSFVVAALFVGLLAVRVAAISPSAILVYGGKMTQPVLLQPSGPPDFPTFELLWWQAGPFRQPTRTLKSDPQLLASLKDRAFVSLAIFWGRYEPDQLKAENASQHGRFYPETSSAPAVVVTTVPDMQKKSNPIPGDLGGFSVMWTLSPQEITTLKGVGFPGL